MWLVFGTVKRHFNVKKLHILIRNRIESQESMLEVTEMVLKHYILEYKYKP